MTHNIKSTSHPITLNLGGNYSVQMFSVSTNDGENFSVIQFAYIIDGGGAMDLVSMDIGGMEAALDRMVNIDDIRAEATKVVRNYSGMNRLLNDINNMEK